LKRHHYR